ncbi:beta-alanine-activating enzyme [Pelodytes ibericus]
MLPCVFLLHVGGKTETTRDMEQPAGVDRAAGPPRVTALVAAATPAPMMPTISNQGTLHSMVVEAVEQHEDRKAVCYHRLEQPPLFLTYKQMMELAGELTGFLKSHCLYSKKYKIGLYCQPGIHLPSWIMGILQVPAAYCPMDPGSPSHLTTLLMERCSLEFMLVENDKVKTFKVLFRGWAEQDSCSVQRLGVTLFKFLIDKEHGILPTGEKADVQAKSNVQEPTSTGDYIPIQTCREYIDIREEQCLAYVLHTSGTTGVPKIVSVPHSCIVPNIHHLQSIFNISPADVLFLASPLTFDPSVIEMFLALSSGACLLIMPEPIKIMSSRLCELLFHQHNVTVLQVTPTFLRRFGSHAIKTSVLSKDTSLRVLALGGEPFPPVPVLKSWKEPGNQTRIFNLYGITEVSSWATYYEIPHESLTAQTGSDFVPLGRPLHGTIVEVQNDKDCPVEEGEGQVLLGGRERICFLDDEVTLPFGTMRKTGDWVSLKDGEMFFLGRKDNQIKRHGKRLSIEYVQQAVESFAKVEACALSWYEARQLVLFVIPKGSLEKKFLWKELQTHLLSYAVPDDIVLINSLPFTKHGKIDLIQLNLMYSDYLRKMKTPCLIQEEAVLWNSLQNIWKGLLSLPEDSPAIEKDSMFLLSGGDSLLAIRFQVEVERLLGKAVPGLVEVILSNTMLDIQTHISTALYLVEEKESSKINLALTRNHSNTNRADKTTNHANKRKAPVSTEPETFNSSFISLSRGNKMFINRHISGLHAEECCWMSGYNQEVTALLKMDFSSSESKIPKNIPTCHSQMSSSYDLVQTHVPSISVDRPVCLSLQERWKSNTGKCVDGSPLLLKAGATVTVYIGSHSHRVQALDLQSGEMVWEKVLGDRIESSAAVSKCGNFILIGCYDGALYTLNRNNGETHWVFTTEDAIKSSPTVDPLTGLVFVGSHDHQVYALDVEVKQCVWKSYCSGGAVFSSPCINSEPYHIYTATLGGFVTAFHPPTGKRIWTHSCGKPVFTSPQCSPDHVFIGCVDEILYCFSHSGEQIWHLTTNGPIFSSPCISNISKKIIFGSHDGFVYCCDTGGVLLWRYKTSSRVYATPFVFPHPHIQDMELVAAASTDGSVWILDAESGQLNNMHKLDGEVFSSPVVWGSNLVIGCRNDYVYCLDVIGKSKSV